MIGTTLLKALLLLTAASVLLVASAPGLGRERSLAAAVQLVGAVFLVVVALTHVFEAHDLFPWMQWGQPHSVGHYLDLSSAVLGITLTPVGSLMRLVRRRKRHGPHA